MPIDPTIIAPQGLQSPNTPQTLSSIVGNANTLQGMQARQLSMQAQQQQNAQGAMDLQERQNVAAAMKNNNSFDDGNGYVDLNKAIPAIMQAAPTTGSKYLQQMAAANQNRTVAEQALGTQSDENRTRVGNALAGLAQRDPTKVTSTDINQTFDAAEALMGNTPQMQPVLEKARAQINSAPDMMSKLSHIQQMAKLVLPQATQQEMGTPNALGVNNGQQSYAVNTRPGATVPQGGIVPGSYTQQQLPPGTPTMRDGTPGYLGPQAPNQAQPGQQAPNGQPFVASGLPVGATKNIENNVNEMNRHYASLQDSSSTNQGMLALANTIKNMAPGAFTGVGGDRKQYINGLAQAFGINPTGDAVTDTNLLNKAVAQLNATSPAATDAMRSIVQAGQPNSGMDQKAIMKAADTLVGQVRANVAERNMLAPYTQANGGQGDVAGYQAARQRIEAVNDPRAYQYQSLPPGSQARKDFVKSLSPQDASALHSKIQSLEQLGAFQQ